MNDTSGGPRTGFGALRGHRYMNLTTFRKSGRPVTTPVWFAEDASGERLYVFTHATTGKAKRIRNDGRVVVEPSGVRGRPLGPKAAGMARLLGREAPVARALLDGKYGWQKWAFGIVEPLLGKAEEQTYIEITPYSGDLPAAPQEEPRGEPDGGRRAGALSRLGRALFRPERYRWWHALAFWGLVNLPNLGSSRAADRGWYESQRQAPFAPPGWVFGPAWTINNISVLWGNLRLLNLPGGTPGRRGILLMQGISWVLYASFGYVYFRKRSPILALVWTAAFYALTIVSALLSLKADKKVTLSFVTLLFWLSLATPVAVYQAARNPDQLFGTPPPVG